MVAVGPGTLATSVIDLTPGNPGAHHLPKVLQLRANGDLDRACRRPLPTPPLGLSPGRGSAASVAPRRTGVGEPPFQPTIPARFGRDAARPWVEALCWLASEPTIRWPFPTRPCRKNWDSNGAPGQVAASLLFC